jgi:cytochrome c-type biogenesis protein CcmH/NrfF
LWVWVGFMVLGFGTLVCLIPQRVVDRLQWKPKTRLGRAADVSIVVTIVCVVMLGIASQAQADTPQTGAATEHVPAGMGMGDASSGAMSKNRPHNDTEARAMNELLCPCGCSRQSILDCPCGTAADLRGKVIGMMANADLSSQAGRDHAYDSVLAVFKADYGEAVWSTPRSSTSWLFPALAALGGGDAGCADRRRRDLRRQARRRARGYGLAMAVSLLRLLRLSTPLAKGAVDGIAAKDDPLRAVKVGVFGAALVVGWVFIVWSNKFHVTAPVVIVCLGYLCVVSLVFNLWRTGAAAAAPDEVNDDWGRPIGELGELEKEKRTMLKAIKEAEFDYAMGKLSKRDAESLIAQYRSRAIDVIKQLDHKDGDAKLSVREQIDREVKARRELGKRGQKLDKAAKTAKAKPVEVDAKPVEVDAKPVEVDAKPVEVAKPEQVELVLAEGGDVERAETFLGKRAEINGVERIDGGVCVSIADHKHVVALIVACEGEGIHFRTISVRTAKPAGESQ